MATPKFLVVDGDGKIKDVHTDAEEAIDQAFALGAVFRVIPMAEAYVTFGVRVPISVYMEKLKTYNPPTMPTQSALHALIKVHQDDGFSRPIQFIKDMRPLTGLGLGEAKGYCDWARATPGLPVL